VPLSPLGCARPVLSHQVRATLNIPVLGLFDADPYGLKILSVYM
jgi:DNA topoisomerase VI subunit A